MKKPTIKIIYKTLQSESGLLLIGKEKHYFYRLRLSGNMLVLYDSNNGLDSKGRISEAFNLNDYQLVEGRSYEWDEIHSLKQEIKTLKNDRK